jgi:2-C-methyl-D-erythritol 2,4-cyclodiphosphate synthase
MLRIGYGYDVHRLVEGRKLLMGGVEIPFEKGLLGHSDADVLIHAIIDALLGALALGDIGAHFPDNDIAYKDIDSRILLRQVYELILDKGWKLANLDSTICAQAPKLRPFIEAMRLNLSVDLSSDLDQISVKATTEEGLGVSGQGEGISASCVVLLTCLSCTDKHSSQGQGDSGSSPE